MTDRLKVLDELEQEIARVAYATPERRSWWHRRGTLALVVMVTGATGTAALAAAGGILTGEPVKDPPGVIASPTEGLGILKRGSAALTPLRVRDPAGGPAWGLRTLETTRGQGCVQVGRVVENRLGILGQDGSFNDDGRFHELPEASVERRECQPLDAAGNTFVAVSYQGLPASGTGGDCAVQPLPKFAVPGTKTLPLCARRSLRILFYGALGPRARSVTYLDERSRVRTARTAGPDGAYLVVLRPSAKRPAKGYFVPSTSPGSGLRSVRYDDGSVCRIRSPRSLGGAKRCPRVGFVAPKLDRLTDAEVRTPVRASFAPRPVVPPGGQGEASWELTVRLTSRVAVDQPSYYVISTAPDDAERCGSGNGFSPVARAIRPGEEVVVTTFIPRRCRGIVRGRAALHQPGPDDDPLPYAGIPRPGEPVAGSYMARIPR